MKKTAVEIGKKEWKRPRQMVAKMQIISELKTTHKSNYKAVIQDSLKHHRIDLKY